MAFTNKPFIWKNNGVTPPETLQNSGFVGGKKLPAPYVNAQWTATYKAIEELQAKAAEKEMVAINLDKKADVTYVNDMLSNVSADTSSLQINFIDLAIEVETSKNAELNAVTANIAIETFLTLDDVVLERGSYNATNKWLEV